MIDETLRKKYFIIDFDSTFVQSEGLEELAAVALRNRTDRDLIIGQIKQITNLGMEGKISFEESLKRRLKILQGNKLHIEQVVGVLKKKVSPSIKRNKQFFKQFKDRIYIISGGFKEFIMPIVKSFDVKKSHVFANTFILDNEGKIIGLDRKNRLAQDGGKVEVVKSLKLDGEISVVGDGFTDYQIKAMGAAEHFVAFTENVMREEVLKKADHIVPNLDEFLFINNLTRSHSYPKNRIKALLLGGLGKKTIELFQKEGYRIEQNMQYLTDAHILVATKMEYFTKKQLRSANLLMVAGFLQAGYKSDLSLYNKKGIVVFFGREENIARKIIEYVNSGDTYTSFNIPQVSLKKEKNTHRLLHLHNNVPGILAKINSTMAKFNINILAQYLKTNEKIGYVITDINREYDKMVLSELKRIPDTIRFRVLY